MKYLLQIGFLCIFVVSTTHAQTTKVEDDFEGGSTITSWFGDDCLIDTAFSNPFQEGMNTSNRVLQYQDAGGQFANVRFEVTDYFDLTSHHSFTLKIYVPSNGVSGNQPNQVSLKLQNGNLAAPWSTQSEIIKPITLDQWQVLTFDFAMDDYINLDMSSAPPTQRMDFNRVVIQVNGENNNDPVIAYLDDVNYNGTTAENPIFDKLVWSDEFEVDGALNAAKWFQQTQLPAGESWYNGEVQHYTDRLENALVEGGVLKIMAKKEVFADQGVVKAYTSARLNSKFAFQYGRVEVRAKLPTGTGTWPAIWMLGQNVREEGAYWYTQGWGTTPWPACGEIDIMEHWGDNQNFVQSATHTPSSYGDTVNKGGRTVATASSEFHIYALEWTSNKLVFSIDSTVHYTYQPIVRDANTWPFDAKQYLLLNLAILPHIDPNFIEDAMEIDYVRIYQEQVVATPEKPTAISLSAYPVPFTDQLTLQVPHVSDQSTQLSIYALDGQQIRTQQASIDQQKLQLHHLDSLSAGVYLIRFMADHKHYKAKVIKQ